MQMIDIAKLRKLLAEATLGPWHYNFTTVLAHETRQLGEDVYAQEKNNDALAKSLNERIAQLEAAIRKAKDYLDLDKNEDAWINEAFDALKEALE